MSTFIASGEFDVSQVTYNIGQIGDTIAHDSVITQDTTVVQAPAPEVDLLGKCYITISLTHSLTCTFNHSFTFTTHLLTLLFNTNISE